MTKTQTYLTDILQAIDRITTYTREGRDVFNTDIRTQDAVARNFSIIGEVVKRLPSDLTATQPDIPWRAIAGFRDVLIHDYARIDLDEVWLTIESDLPALRKAVQTLLDKLDAPADSDEQ